MSLTLAQPGTHFPKGFLANVETAQHATRGTGANVHDSLRSLLYYLKVEHGFTLEDFAQLHACPDSPTRRNDLTPGEAKRLIKGMFTDGFDQKVQLREEAKQRGEVGPQENPHPSLVTDAVIALWKEKADLICEGLLIEYGRHVKATNGEVLHDIPTADVAPYDTLALLHHENPSDLSERGTPECVHAMTTLFQENETISLVTACNEQGSPIANDVTMYPEGWRKKLSTPNNFGGRGGVWWRHNPVKLKGGSGKGGAVTDKDIHATKYLLLESDVLNLQQQAGVFLHLIRNGLPIRCVTDSGGKSLHALVEMRPEAYQAYAPALLASLHRDYGFDKGNANPSRMSRAPGFTRRIKARNGTEAEQRLLYLSPPSGIGFPMEGKGFAK